MESRGVFEQSVSATRRALSTTTASTAIQETGRHCSPLQISTATGMWIGKICRMPARIFFFRVKTIIILSMITKRQHCVDLSRAVPTIGAEVPLLDQQIAQVTQATMKYYGLTDCKMRGWLHTTDTRGYRARHSLLQSALG